MEVIRHEVKGVVGGAALSAKTMQQLAPGVLQEIMEGDRSGRNILHKHNSFLPIFFYLIHFCKIFTEEQVEGAGERGEAGGGKLQQGGGRHHQVC